MQEQIDDLKKRIEIMEKAQNLDQNVLLFENIFTDKGSYGADLTRSVSIPAGGGSFSLPENPIGTLKVEYKGVKYRLLLYSLT